MRSEENRTPPPLPPMKINFGNQQSSAENHSEGKVLKPLKLLSESQFSLSHVVANDRPEGKKQIKDGNVFKKKKKIKIRAVKRGNNGT